MIRNVTKEEFDEHLQKMRELTGTNGEAPRSKQPKFNVRERLAELDRKETEMSIGG